MIKNLLLSGLVVLTIGQNLFSQAYSESFNDITTLAGNGWLIQNNSAPVGSISWFQGTAVPDGPFDAFNGAANAYIGVNFNSTGSTGTISNWLITPNRTLKNGDVFTFYTRKPTIGSGMTDYPDRLEVRMSANGASTNVGTGAAAVGDFTTLLLSINPTLVVGGYPQVWTQYTITISGLPAPTSGRIAFRYHVTGAGSFGVASDYIGIDQVDYTPYVCPAFTMTAGGALSGGIAGSAYSTTLTQTGALGAPSFAITAGALPPGLTLSASGTISGTPTATGTFNFTSTLSDASGCTGSQSYSITVVCPANPITFTTFPAICANDTDFALTQGTPAGGTYSGTGVTGGTFSPSAGTQTITYDYTDPYGCAHSSNTTITVNTNPIVTLDPLGAVCADAGSVPLTGGLPVGGNYIGNGTSGGTFNPVAGTQAITYIYVDANSCMGSATETITVNANPTVTQDPINAVCADAGSVALTGGLPAGGTYSGTGVTAANFDPSAGTQVITYTFTDGNGCEGAASETITVNASPTVSLNLPINLMCANWSAATLTGESPAGGTFTGTGVTGNQFNPATATVGNNVITYSFTDGNGCSAQATNAIVVDLCAGVDDISANSVVVYPNPSNGIFRISANESVIEEIQLFDISGREIKIQPTMNANEATIDLTSMSVGSYILKLKIDGKTVETKLSKN